MDELIKTLEEIQARTAGDSRGMTPYEIETACEVRQALSQAREFAGKVDLLHETIRDNVEHSIAESLVKRAVTLEKREGLISQAIAWSTEARYLRKAAEWIRQGEWKK